MKLTIDHDDVVWAAKLHRTYRKPYLATVDRGHCVGESGNGRDTGLALPFVRLADLTWQAAGFRHGLPNSSLLLAVDRFQTGNMGGFATPRFLRADVEALAWHRHQVRRQFSTRNDERGNGTDGHRYAWRAVSGLRAFVAHLERRSA